MGPRARRARQLARRFYDEQRGLIEHALRSRRSMTIKPSGPRRGTVLFSYLLEPWEVATWQALPTSHTNFWESRTIGDILLKRGYALEVINFDNHAHIAKRADYDLLLSLRTNLEKLAPQVGDDCVKVLHADVAHVLFHNAAEANRLLALQQRRGVTLPPRRYSPPNLAIEHADCAVVVGNEFARSTYEYAGKPLHHVRKSSVALHPHPGERDVEDVRHTFLWLSSAGFVHKGLDLVLEAFAGLPDLKLLVAAPLHQEPDFVEVYDRELHHTPNIELIGWIDVATPAFDRLLARCVAVVYPSSSEGASGAVVECMHGGLLPIVTREAAVNTDGFGTLLPAAGVAEVQEAVRAIAEAPAAELRERAEATWEFARRNQSREGFREDYDRLFGRLLGGD